MQMRMRFVVGIRMLQTKSVHVAKNVSAHELDKIFQAVTSSQTCFPNLYKWPESISGNVIVFRFCHRGLKHAVVELLPTVQVERVVEERLLILL